MSEEYTVVVERELTKLITVINSQCDKGWKAQGGILQTVDGQFAQAITRSPNKAGLIQE